MKGRVLPSSKRARAPATWRGASFSSLAMSGTRRGVLLGHRCGGSCVVTSPTRAPKIVPSSVGAHCLNFAVHQGIGVVVSGEHVSSAAGMVKEKVLPRPGSLSTHIRPRHVPRRCPWRQGAPARRPDVRACVEACQNRSNTWRSDWVRCRSPCPRRRSGRHGPPMRRAPLCGLRAG